MEFGLVRKGLDYSRQRKKWVVLMAAMGLSSFGVYRVCRSPAVARKSQKVVKVLGALASVVEAVSDSAEAVGVLSKDLKEFLRSDCDEIPKSLRQVSKIAKSDEFSGLVAGLTGALTVGVLRGYRTEMSGGDVKGDGGGSSSFVDQVMDRMFSKAGSGFVSVVVGSFARNLVMGFYASDHASSRYPGEDTPWWVDVVCSERGKEVIGDCIQMFVSTAVAIYLEKTMHINTYDEMLAGLTNPKHEAQVKDMLVSVCNGAVETFIKTSHQVLTYSDPHSNHTSKSFSIDQCPSPKQIASGLEVISSALKRTNKSFDEGKNKKGWMSKVSSTLSVPSNRRFVLDVTGRVTFETVKSFLTLVLEKLLEALRRSVDIVREEVVDRGVEVVRYATTKTSVVATICISLCLHILNSPWLFVPSRAVEYL
uniref:Protein PHLOEM PROTEIN 2-LIKE A10 n=1 Tax=Kalanchoe fedtschenkoi TaxID=63787 RepID=A0A7N0V098_KALFE